MDLSTVSQKVNDLHQLCKGLRFSEAKKAAQAIYPDSMSWVLPIIKNTRCENPLPISRQLVDVIVLPGIRMQDDDLFYYILEFPKFSC